MSAVIGQCKWPFVNFDNDNSRSNPCETIINKGNVSTLTVIWSDTTASVQGAVVVSNNVAYYGNVLGTFYARNAQTGALIFPPRTFAAPIGSPAT